MHPCPTQQIPSCTTNVDVLLLVLMQHCSALSISKARPWYAFRKNCWNKITNHWLPTKVVWISNWTISDTADSMAMLPMPDKYRNFSIHPLTSYQWPSLDTIFIKTLPPSHTFFRLLRPGLAIKNSLFRQFSYLSLKFSRFFSPFQGHLDKHA